MRIRFGANFAVFILFFGLSLLDALQNAAWFRAALWLAIAVVFLVADSRVKKMN